MQDIYQEKVMDIETEKNTELEAHKYTDDELREMINLGGITPSAEEKMNIHSFLFNVAVAKDTSKIGYLRSDKDIDELGFPRLPVRTNQELSYLCNNVFDMEYMGDIFANFSQITTATSLSRDGFLIKQATTQTKQVADISKKKPIQNKGWFSKKDQGEEQDG